ncbi:MAG: putative Zn-dependent peptidase [bacterium P3]|nr:MAG: putative Zn-dependent peptidase [bacterium P3]KWW42358.1 MAG: putative Zn-dependent peptidase [bacterium F083]
MIAFERRILDNGLTVICHRDTDTPLATVNLLYGAGSRNEEPHRTGFAHLFEHLMFGGTRRVPDYDRVVNSLGGESNAFTNCDYTNYYLTVPVQHLEAALQLEADRMQGLDLTPETLQVQQRVVTEEYHQRYLNQPYGDVWMLLRPLSYTQHPYRWCTIGEDIAHVQQASMDDVRSFFDRYYRPSNAILAVAGPIDIDRTFSCVERRFGSIVDSRPPCCAQHLPPEPDPSQARCQTVRRPVAADAFYRTYLMCDRHDGMFPAMDLLSDILSNGDSSRLRRRLVKEQGLFSEIDACVTSDLDRGLFVISGKLCDGVDMALAERAVDAELHRLSDEPDFDRELDKVVNKFESTFLFSHYRVADRAHNLCYYQWLGDLQRVNDEPARYRLLSPSDLRSAARRYLQPSCACTLYYLRDR